MGELEVVPLGELGADRPSAFATGPFGSAVSAKNFVSEGVPMLRGGNLSEDVGIRLDESEIVFISEQLARKYSRSIVEPGDLVFTCWGTVGQLGLIEHGNRFDRYLVSNKQMKLTVDSRRVIPLFLYYFLSQRSMLELVRGQAIGSSVPGFNLGQLKALPIKLPPLQTQRAIVEVLGALDDKIAANGQVVARSDHLIDAEAMAAILRSSKSAKLEEIATVVKGVSYRSVDLGDSATALATLKSIDRAGGFTERGYKPFVGAYRPEQKLRQGDVVVAQTDITQSGDVIGRAVRVPALGLYEHQVATLDLAIVRPKSGMPSEYLLAALRQPAFREHCRSRASGTTVLHLGRGAVESYLVPVVDLDIATQYAEFARAVYEVTDSKLAESRRLAHTRDELLPLVMSGKLRVKDAETAVSEVL